LARPAHLALLCVGAAAGGCCGVAGPIVSTRPHHVLILPGIQGMAFDFAGLAGFERQIERENPLVSAQIWDWTRIEPQFGSVPRLKDLARNRRRAKVLAAEIATWRLRHRDAGLSIVGYSAGTGIALFACDELPPDAALDRIVLVSSGLSPSCDLDAALARATGGVFNYFSDQDTTVLRDFTTRHGTIDRVYGPSAGCVGFRCDDPRLRQLRWTPAMKRLGNPGGHTDGFAQGFAREYLLPLLDPDGEIPQGWRTHAPQGSAESSGGF
jgi:hypothetical protein